MYRRCRKRTKYVVCTKIIVATVISNAQVNDVVGPQQLDTNDPIESEIRKMMRRTH